MPNGVFGRERVDVRTISVNGERLNRIGQIVQLAHGGEGTVCVRNELFCVRIRLRPADFNHFVGTFGLGDCGDVGAGTAPESREWRRRPVSVRGEHKYPGLQTSRPASSIPTKSRSVLSTAKPWTRNPHKLFGICEIDRCSAPEREKTSTSPASLFGREIKISPLTGSSATELDPPEMASVAEGRVLPFAPSGKISTEAALTTMMLPLTSRASAEGCDKPVAAPEIVRTGATFPWAGSAYAVMLFAAALVT